MKSRRTKVIAVSAVSGGGKTTVINQLNKVLPKSKVLHFDDYEFDGPNDICDWVDRGADYNEWILSPLIKDLCALISDENQLYDWILLDYPFGYVHNEVGVNIDFTVFIDTPLDIAMARRIMRDFKETTFSELENNLSNYLSRGRNAYIESVNTVKPNCDLIIDGSISFEDIATMIKKRIIEFF